MGKIVGIDLGTTYSAIAMINDYAKPELISNREGERITPSVILFEGDALTVGSYAKNSAVAEPDNVVQFVKRQMGNPAWKFRTENGQIYKPEELSAFILKRLIEDAETLSGEKITDAVITVPAYFNDAQRKATFDAGAMAGLNVRRIINEPTAAALAYGFDNIETSQTIVIYDLGGGTFDVTIMKLDCGNIDVVASDGDKNLGGFDFDNRIMEFFNEEFMAQDGEDLNDNPNLQQDLRTKAEAAKKALSTKSKTKAFLSAGGKNISVELTLEKFKELTASLIKRTAIIMEGVLEDAQLNWNEIDKVLLVGGSTRIQAVSEMVKQITGKVPSLELHPDEVVAMGAALQGEMLLAEDGKSDLVEQGIFHIVEIKDVVTHSMGVVAQDTLTKKEINSIVLEKNTKKPCKTSNTYSTVMDNQTEIKVLITEGESEDLDNNIRILADQKINIDPYPEGAPVEVFFEYDADGMVHVRVFDLTAKKMLGDEIIIDRKDNLTEDEVNSKKETISKIQVN